MQSLHQHCPRHLAGPNGARGYLPVAAASVDRGWHRDAAVWRPQELGEKLQSRPQALSVGTGASPSRCLCAAGEQGCKKINDILSRTEEEFFPRLVNKQSIDRYLTCSLPR